MPSRSHSRRQTLRLGSAQTLVLAGGRLRTANAKGQILPVGRCLCAMGSVERVRASEAPRSPSLRPRFWRPIRMTRSRGCFGSATMQSRCSPISRAISARWDAFVRELHLGLGCAIENMLVAAGPNGYDAEVATVEGSLANFTERRSPVAAASVRLKKRAPSAPDGFYRAIALRHTNRYAYERSKAVPADWREFLRRTGDDQGARVILFDEGEDRRVFDAAVVEATQAIIDDKTMIANSDRWFRSSPAEIEAYRDGPTLDAAGLSFFALTYARLFSVSPETSHSAWLRNTRDVQLASAPLTGLIAVSDRYDRKATLAAGRVWQRLHLSATARGLAMQPLNQPIEMIDRERQTGQGDQWAKRIARLTGDEWQATFSFRAGFASRPAPSSPRRRLKDVVLE